MKAGSIATMPAVTAPSNRSVGEVARQMQQNDVGCVVVVDERNAPIGIVTDRDLVTRALARDLPTDYPVGLLMSRDVVSLAADADLEAVENTMAAWGKRRIPVVNGEGVVVGLVSHDDVMRSLEDAIAKATTATRTRRPRRDSR